MIRLQGYTWVCRDVYEFTRFTGIFVDNGGSIAKY